MDYKNDNRTPRDRVTGEFLSELLFTDPGNCPDCRIQSNTAERTTPTLARSNAAKNNCDGKTRGGNVEIVGDYSLAMAYVPMQEFGDLFDLERGFCEGTIFKALRFPFYPTPCRKENM